MYECKSCGHQWTKGEVCPHCGSNEFESSEPIAEVMTPEAETDDSTETDEEE